MRGACTEIQLHCSPGQGNLQTMLSKTSGLDFGQQQPFDVIGCAFVSIVLHQDWHPQRNHFDIVWANSIIFISRGL